MTSPVGNIALAEAPLGRRFQLLRRLAVGGMAELFLARARGIEGFEKPVVLKRILPQYAYNQDYVAMFLDEARLAATLHHPNIVQVYDIGRFGSIYYFTMEYIHGETLRSVLHTTERKAIKMPLGSALHVAIGMASALHHAHEKRGLDGKPLEVVHRDVSPSNVLLTYDGCVKVVDFGIAKATTRAFQTRTGTLKGKVAYMSPEQCRGESVDRRSDVFSLGIVMYEMTTGSSLFRGENELAILKQIDAGDIPTPSSRRPGYPPELERIVLRALAYDRDDRYQSAEDLLIDLERFAAARGIAAGDHALARHLHDLFGDPPESLLAGGHEWESEAAWQDWISAEERVAKAGVTSEFSDPNLRPIPDAGDEAAAAAASATDHDEDAGGSNAASAATDKPAASRGGALRVLTGATLLAMLAGLAVAYVRHLTPPATKTTHSAAVSPRPATASPTTVSPRAATATKSAAAPAQAKAGKHPAAIAPASHAHKHSGRRAHRRSSRASRGGKRSRGRSARRKHAAAHVHHRRVDRIDLGERKATTSNVNSPFLSE